MTQGSRVFTTWANLLVQVQNDLANYKSGVRNYQLRGNSVTYSSRRELTEFLEYVEERAAQEKKNRKRPRGNMVMRSGGIRS